MAFDRSWFVLSGKLKPIKIKGAHVRYSEELAEKLIVEFTKKGDTVLDPFAGFGTTLLVAQKLGRIGFGVEYEKERYDFIKRKLNAPSVIVNGSSLTISHYKFPKVDFCMTSPPYMRSFDDENPFSNYHKRGSYKQYLKDISTIYRQIKKLMKKDAVVIVEIGNTFGEGHPMTPLAWDVAKELSKIFFFEREIIHCTTEREASQGSNHSYLLAFRNK
ncbi:TPA: site-specific DNA-methyltransferase [Candidatus Woesearchaeota archaeon]|nr:site-specific DNA-methyltransferase [Candidatus Woesearchaeota archaeon]